jgi:hypothetical protein
MEAQTRQSGYKAPGYFGKTSARAEETENFSENNQLVDATAAPYSSSGPGALCVWSGPGPLATEFAAADRLFCSLALGRAFASWTHGNVRDPEMLAASAGILFLAAILASIGPALTATAIQPMQALRKE